MPRLFIASGLVHVAPCAAPRARRRSPSPGRHRSGVQRAAGLRVVRYARRPTSPAGTSRAGWLRSVIAGSLRQFRSPTATRQGPVGQLRAGWPGIRPGWLGSSVRSASCASRTPSPARHRSAGFSVPPGYALSSVRAGRHSRRALAASCPGPMRTGALLMLAPRRPPLRAAHEPGGLPGWCHGVLRRAQQVRARTALVDVLDRPIRGAAEVAAALAGEQPRSATNARWLRCSCLVHRDGTPPGVRADASHNPF